MSALFEGENPAHRPVEKIPVMGNDDDDPLKMIQIILKHCQCCDVEVVGRLIQNENIGRAHQHPQQIQPPFFPTGKAPDLRILLASFKQKALQHLRRRHASLRRRHKFRNLTDVVNHAHIRIHMRHFLRIIADFHSLSDDNFTTVGLFLSGQKLHQRRLSASVCADKRDTVIFQKNIRKVVNQNSVPVSLLHMTGFQGRPAKARGNAAELHLSVRLRCLAIFQLFIAFQTRFLLCRTRPRAALYPCKLCPKDILAL